MKLFIDRLLQCIRSDAATFKMFFTYTKIFFFVVTNFFCIYFIFFYKLTDCFVLIHGVITPTWLENSIWPQLLSLVYVPDCFENQLVAIFLIAFNLINLILYFFKNFFVFCLAWLFNAKFVSCFILYLLGVRRFFKSKLYGDIYTPMELEEIITFSDIILDEVKNTHLQLEVYQKIRSLNGSDVVLEETFLQKSGTVVNHTLSIKDYEKISGLQVSDLEINLDNLWCEPTLKDYVATKAEVLIQAIMEAPRSSILEDLYMWIYLLKGSFSAFISYVLPIWSGAQFVHAAVHQPIGNGAVAHHYFPFLEARYLLAVGSLIIILLPMFFYFSFVRGNYDSREAPRPYTSETYYYTVRRRVYGEKDISNTQTIKAEGDYKFFDKFFETVTKLLKDDY